MNQKAKRYAAILLCLCLSLSFISMQIHLLGQAEHDCMGENCPVCAQIDAVNQMLKQLSLGGICAGLDAVVFLFLLTAVASVWFVLHHFTLVCQKVRMNN